MTAPSLSGSFWIDQEQNASLVMRTTGPGTAVLSPGQPLRVKGSLTGPDGKRRTFEDSLILPLAVSETSVLPVTLPRPERAGTYSVTLEAMNAPFAVTGYGAPIAFGAEHNGPASELAPLQLSAAHLAERATPGGSVPVTLTWRVLDRPSGDYSVGLRLVDKDGRNVATDDRTLIGGPDPVRGWRPGQVVTTTGDAQVAGRCPGPLYDSRVSVYNGDQGYRYFDASGAPGADFARPILAKPASLPQTSLPPASTQARFAHDIYLLSVEARPPTEASGTFEVTTSWAAAPDPAGRLYDLRSPGRG